MFPIDFKIGCGIWCALGLYAAAQDAVPDFDRLEAEAAERLRESDRNHDRGGPRRDMSPEMQAISRNPDLVDNLKAEDLAKMSLDDPLLKYAYYRVFSARSYGFQRLAPPQELALADMRRRGEAVSPMLLKLMAESQENVIEDSILTQIEYLGTVRIEPFLDYARRLLRERTQTMTVDSAGVATHVLGRHGTKEDEALLEWVLKERPFVAYDVNKSLKELRTRLNPPQPESRPERRKSRPPSRGWFPTGYKLG